MHRRALALDPFALARRQVELDRERTERFPMLFARKRARMSVSPLAFLRGSAPLFYEILAARPELADGPRGSGWIVGDMHLENVGAFRDAEDRVVFDLNDFDDAVIAPWRYDVLRLATSVLLAGREFGTSGPQAIALVETLLAAYRRAQRAEAKPPPPSPLIEGVLERARARTRKQLLDDRAPRVGRERRFVRGSRYMELPKVVRRLAPKMLEAYRLAFGRKAEDASGTVTDAAQRVAGTGSLGVLRIAMLVDGTRIVDMKEARPSSLGSLARRDARNDLRNAERVVAAAQAMLVRPPRHLCAIEGLGMQMVARPLAPQLDKLDLTQLRAGRSLDGLVHFVGDLLARAHQRAARKAREPWSERDMNGILDHAIVLAGIHEAAWLAYCRA